MVSFGTACAGKRGVVKFSETAAVNMARLRKKVRGCTCASAAEHLELGESRLRNSRASVCSDHELFEECWKLKDDR